MFAIVMILEFITLIDYRLHPMAWILPAVMLISGGLTNDFDNI